MSAQEKDGEDEFAHITPTPRRRSPMVALAVLALGAVLLWHLRADLSYAFRPRTPIDLGDARSAGALEDNSFVTVRGQPDRRNALFIEPRGEKTRQTFFRLLGTDARLFVRAEDTARRAQLEDRWTGRLRRFDTQPWAPSLRAYYTNEVKAARYIAVGTLRLALRDHSSTLRDRAGEPLTLTPTTPVHIDRLFPDDLVVSMSPEKYPNADDAKHELERLGMTVKNARQTEKGAEFELVVGAPEATRAAVIEKLEKADLAFAAHQERETVPFGELSEPDATVKSISIDAPIVIADQAFVLTEGEAPSAYWWAPLLVAILVAFAAFNVWYLVRGRRDMTST
jgi:hypothetical protein